MANTTTEGVARQIGLPSATLLRQLVAAGIADKSPGDELSDEEKLTLLTYLRGHHGGEDAGGRRKITLKRKSTSQVMQTSRTGPARTVQVEVRKKRTFVKRSVLEESAPPEPEAPAQPEVPAAMAPEAPAPEPVEAAPAVTEAAPAAPVEAPAPAPAPAPATAETQEKAAPKEKEKEKE